MHNPHTFIVKGSKEQLQQFINDGIIEHPTREQISHVMFDDIFMRLWLATPEDERFKKGCRIVIDSSETILRYRRKGIVPEGFVIPERVWNFGQVMLTQELLSKSSVSRADLSCQAVPTIEEDSEGHAYIRLGIGVPLDTDSDVLAWCIKSLVKVGAYRDLAFWSNNVSDVCRLYAYGHKDEFLFEQRDSLTWEEVKQVRTLKQMDL